MLYKSSRVDSSVIVSSSVYTCECGNTEMNEGDVEVKKTCAKCDNLMQIVAVSSEVEESSEEDESPEESPEEIVSKDSE